MSLVESTRSSNRSPASRRRPRGLTAAIAKMKAANSNAIIVEPFHNRKIAEKVAGSTGAKVVSFAQYPGALPSTETYVALIDGLVSQLTAALKD